MTNSQPSRGRSAASGVANFFEALVKIGANCGSFMLILLVVTIILNTVLRHFFSMGSIMFEELQWHLNGIAVMACLADAYRVDAHVRVDVLRDRMSERRRAIIEILGVLFLLLPFLSFLIYYSWRTFFYSWQLGEGSPMPSGLPARYIIKGVVVIGLVLLFLQGLSILIRSIQRLQNQSVKS